MAVELKLVAAPAARSPARGSFRAAGLFAGLLLALALVATLAGADHARRPVRALERGRHVLELMLRDGSSAPAATQLLLELGDELGRRPLDATTRIVYASVLLERCRRIEDRQAPAFHAALAASYAPVTVPVVKPAALVLVRSGREEEALQWTRAMFAYDPAAAARLLVQLEPFLGRAALERGLPDLPAAWLEWSWQERALGREADADRRVEAARRRWPTDRAAVEVAAQVAIARTDWARLAQVLVPIEATLPAGAGDAVLLLHRARLRAERGEPERALADVRQALALREDATTLTLAGDVAAAAGAAADARKFWNGASYALGTASSTVALRQALALRLAELEDAHGRPSDALRAWRLLLALSPGDPRAQRRIDDLSGFARAPAAAPPLTAGEAVP